MDFRQTKVEALHKIAEEAYLLSFKRTFKFIPGQVVALSLSTDEDPRYYSIASSNHSDSIEILFDIKPGGKLSPKLAELHPGSILYHTLPSGCFLPVEEPSVWIAAGTGIAPFRSMLLSGVTPAFQMIQGARTPDNLYFYNELNEVFGDHYYPCCSREQKDKIYFGRITNFLENMEVISPALLYYLCGSTEIVVDAREILLKREVPYANIISEIYF